MSTMPLVPPFAPIQNKCLLEQTFLVNIIFNLPLTDLPLTDLPLTDLPQSVLPPLLLDFFRLPPPSAPF